MRTKNLKKIRAQHRASALEKKLEHSRVSAHKKKIGAQQGKCARKKIQPRQGKCAEKYQLCWGLFNACFSSQYKPLFPYLRKVLLILFQRLKWSEFPCLLLFYILCKVELL